MRLIDSNILVYAFDFSEGKKQSIAKNIMKEIFSGKINIILSTQNLSEFYLIVTKKIKNPISSKEAEETIVDISYINNVSVKTIKITTIINAINISEKYSINYWDALIVAVMQENYINHIVTENEKDFKKIPGIIVTNPFK